MTNFSNDIFLNIGKKFNEINFEIMQKFEYFNTNQLNFSKNINDVINNFKNI